MNQIKRELHRQFFDFSEELTFKQKVSNIFLVFYLDAFWVTAMSIILALLGYPMDAIIGKIKTNIWFVIFGQDFFGIGIPALFFLACVWAPLWEEFAFRVFPLNLNRTAFLVRDTKLFYLYFALLSSIIFGFGHGSAVNILFQGFLGLSFCWLYLKNNRSYRSIVFAHALWNFMIIILFGF